MWETTSHKKQTNMDVPGQAYYFDLNAVIKKNASKGSIFVVRDSSYLSLQIWLYFHGKSLITLIMVTFVHQNKVSIDLSIVWFYESKWKYGLSLLMRQQIAPSLDVSRVSRGINIILCILPWKIMPEDCLPAQLN